MLLFIAIFAHAEKATRSSGVECDASNSLVANQTVGMQVSIEVGGLIIAQQSLFYSSIF